MIKANELRIGNWISAKRGVFGQKHRKVTLNTLKLASWSIKDYKGEDEINPIPLTPEILEKAGFENLNTEYSTQYKKGKLLIEISPYDSKYQSRMWWNEENSLYIKEEKYVHQLQNLYFALTGEELEIKL